MVGEAGSRRHPRGGTSLRPGAGSLRNVRRSPALLLLLPLLLGPAHADPGPLEQLAPTQEELDEALLQGEAALARSQALQEAVLLLQGALGERRGEARRLPVCEEPQVTSLVARSRVFGAAWRDAAQRLRVEADRVGRMAARGTAVAGAGRVARLAEDAATQAESAALAGAWHGTFVETAFKECGPALVATPGLERAARAEGEPEGDVALIARGGGFLCPGLSPADGRVVVASPRGCVSRSACSCAEAPLLPGAVIEAVAD